MMMEDENLGMEWLTEFGILTLVEDKIPDRRYLKRKEIQ